MDELEESKNDLSLFPNINPIELESLLNIKQADLKVEEWLGNGCTGVVFKGLWRISDGEELIVAIKKMKVRNTEVMAEICREIKTMQSVQFENICKVYGGCLAYEGKEVWMVMEYVDGGDLHSFLEKYGRPLPIELQRSFFTQAAKALASLHNAPNPILHRDIKSLNFLVRNGTTLLLTDFGLSKATALITPDTLTIGTIRWFAPEIIASSKRLWNDKADIYSLGMVFYEIVTRKLPYNKDTNFKDIITKIKTGTLPDFPAECPKEIERIIKSCCKFKQANRPSANELLILIETGRTPMNSKKSSPKTGSIFKSREKIYLSQAALEYKAQFSTYPPVAESPQKSLAESRKRAPINEISLIMNKIYILGATLSSLKQQLEEERKKTGEQSEEYKKLLTRCDEVQAEVTETKLHLSKMWSSPSQNRTTEKVSITKEKVSPELIKQIIQQKFAQEDHTTLQVLHNLLPRPNSTEPVTIARVRGHSTSDTSLRRPGVGTHQRAGSETRPFLMRTTRSIHSSALFYIL